MFPGRGAIASAYTIIADVGYKAHRRVISVDSIFEAGLTRSSMKSLVYLIYGDAQVYHLELSYSVMSALRHQTDPSMRIVLITDERNRRDDLPVEHLIFDAAQMSAWTDGGTYNHAAKAGVVLLALDKLGGQVVLVDTDTYFIDDPCRIFTRINQTYSVMHVCEGSLRDQNGYYDQIIAHSAKTPFNGYDINADSAMWNSGLIGVDETLRGALSEVPELIRYLHSMDPRVHSVEQFAFGEVLARHRTIRPGDDALVHYYGYERHFLHCGLRKLFPEFTPEVFARAQAAEAALDCYPKTLLQNKIFAKVRQSWRRAPDIYRFAQLAYLSAFNEQRPDYANAWASIAIDAIRWNHFNLEHVQTDFKEMRLSKLPEYSWLRSETHSLWERYWTDR